MNKISRIASNRKGALSVLKIEAGLDETIQWHIGNQS
jgi:hypothetical protein